MRHAINRGKFFVSALLALIVCLGAVAGPAPATQPIARVTTTARVVSTPKPVYVDLGWDVANWQPIPPGCLPAVVEAGGRYRDASGAERSIFVGGYYGDRRRVDPAAAAEAGPKYPPATLYVADLEAFAPVPTKSPATIENDIRTARAVLESIRLSNPALRVSAYGVAPVPNYYAPTGAVPAAAAMAKAKSGVTLTADESWQLAQVYDPATLKIDSKRAWARRLLDWQSIDDRATYGLLDSGKRNATGGIEDACDVLVSSCYLANPGERVQDIEAYISGSVAEARRIATGKKLVVVVLCPVYCNDARFDGQPVDLAEWRTLCRAATKSVDAVLIWHGASAWSDAHVRIAQEEMEVVTR